jgi:hypothetical protein
MEVIIKIPMNTDSLQSPRGTPPPSVEFIHLETYPELLRYYEQTCPSLLRSFAPRLIESPRDYWSTKAFSVAAVSARMQMQLQLPSNSAPSIALVSSTARHYGVPTYYITPELTAAALRTDLAPELQLADLHWPFPALVLMLPRGCARQPTEGDAPFVGLCRMPDPHIPATIGFEPAITYVTMMPEANQCPMYHTTQHVDGLSYAGSQDIFFDGSFDSGTDTDREFSRSLWKLGLVLISIMTARPDLIEPGCLLKRVKAKVKGEPPREWWSPTIVGRVFAATADSSVNGHTGSHTAHRPHWVRGHVKSQAHGPRHTLRKILWVQPYRTGRDC